MTGSTGSMSVGDRVAWFRRRRGMPQEVLAGLVNRTTDWLSKVENNRLPVDRVSVVRALAEALGVPVGELLDEPSLTLAADTMAVPALREALLDYRHVTPFAAAMHEEPVPLQLLRERVNDAWRAYQDSRYSSLARDLPGLLSAAQVAVRGLAGDEKLGAYKLLAHSHHVSSLLLTKVGEADLAWVSAERGFQAAQLSGDLTTQGGVVRSIIHSLQSTGRYADAARLTNDAAAFLEPGLADATPEFLSVYGMVFLAGSVAAARKGDRGTVRTFLQEASDAAARLGYDGNHLWTGFGPTNVELHRVTTAMDLGDVQIAIDHGEQVDTSPLPIERRARHSMEIARALSAWNRTDQALAALLDAERIAPEQVRFHAISRQLVRGWLRGVRGKPSYALAQLAKRVRVEV